LSPFEGRGPQPARPYDRGAKRFAVRVPTFARMRSCVLDGEAIVVDERGLSVFDALRYRTHDHAAVLCAFDLLELDGADFRSQPLEQRKATLADLLRGVADGIAFNRHFSGDGAM